MDDCSPLISVGADVQDYGNIFYYTQDGAVIEKPNGEKVVLETSPHDPTPMLPDDENICAARTGTPNDGGPTGQPITLAGWFS